MPPAAQLRVPTRWDPPGLACSVCNLRWFAGGRCIAVDAVRLVCAVLRERGIGERAAMRVDPMNLRSVRVAEKAGFTFVRDFVSGTDTHADGSPTTLSLYVLDL